VAFQQLLRDAHVGLRADGQHVVQHDRLPEARGLREPDVPGHDGLEDLRAEVLACVGRDLLGEVEPVVVHREEHTVDGQSGVDAPLDQVDGVEELRDALERVVLALERDQQGVGGRHHVERDQAERRRAVDEHEVVVPEDRPQRVAHHAVAPLPVDELDLCPREVRRGRKDVEVAELHLAHSAFLDGGLADQDVVDGGLEAVLLEPDATRRVPLWVAVDEKGPLLGDGEAGGEVDGGRRLADAPFLVRDRDDAGHLVLAVMRGWEAEGGASRSPDGRQR
jgi:hypothetical protein